MQITKLGFTFTGQTPTVASHFLTKSFFSNELKNYSISLYFCMFFITSELTGNDNKIICSSSW